jgi:ATP-dependent DNA helicase RecQ
MSHRQDLDGAAPNRSSGTAADRANLATLQTRLRDVFGFERFRPGQAEAIQQALTGRDTLVIMPTGSGKSLCYQLPAAILEGTVVVISPLIALMKDQVESLPPTLAARATFLNATLDRDTMDERLGGIGDGRYRLVYAAPERLRRWPFVHALLRAGVSLFVVDEAHCIDLWGHDFRPDYLFIRDALRRLGEPPLLALTATASPETAAEIGEAYQRQLELVTTGVLRPNLRLEIHRVMDEEARARLVLDLCAHLGGRGIVYVNTRGRAESFARLLRRHRIAADFYHAGLETEEREASQDGFMSGLTRIMVATVAFGMGIDRADVRFVVHADPPQSIEDYVQQSGRAGRDGRPAVCHLLYTPSDQETLRARQDHSALSLEGLRAIYRSLREHAVGRFAVVAIDDLIRDALDAGDENADETRIRVGLSLLERAGLIARHLDFPRTSTLRFEPRSTREPAVARFASAARLRLRQRAPHDSLELLARTGMQHPDLEPTLLDWQAKGHVSYRGSGRDLLVELLRVPVDTATRVPAARQRLLDTQQRRLSTIFEFLESHGCRHDEIARHFGLYAPDSCPSCDHCAPQYDGRPLGRDDAAVETVVGSRGRLDVDPTAIVLQCLRDLPRPVGARGLAHVLRGSVSSPIWPRESPWFGALDHWPSSDVDALIHDLVQRKVLVEDADRLIHIGIGDDSQTVGDGGSAP